MTTSDAGRLECHYCARGEAMKEAGLTEPQRWSVVTLHDRRGCRHVCWPHALWRRTTSTIGGHSKDCPYGSNDIKGTA